MIELEQVMLGEDAQRYCSEMATLFLESPTALRIETLQMKGWIAVPVPDYIGDEEAKLLEVAIRELGTEKGLAFLTAHRTSPAVYAVELDSKGLKRFDAHCMLRPFLLVGAEEEFVLLEEGDYFFVIGGPPAFVERAVGGSVEAARDAFRRYADDPHRWKAATRGWLVEVMRRYSEPIRETG